MSVIDHFSFTFSSQIFQTHKAVNCVECCDALLRMRGSLDNDYVVRHVDYYRDVDSMLIRTMYALSEKTFAPAMFLDVVSKRVVLGSDDPGYLPYYELDLGPREYYCLDVSGVIPQPEFVPKMPCLVLGWGGGCTI